MKNVFCALLFLSLPLHTLLADTMTATPNLANNLETQNQQLNALKHQVKTKEAALKDSETTLQTQSHTLNCLSDLLAAYSHCNKQFNPVDAQQQLQGCMVEARKQNSACANDLPS